MFVAKELSLTKARSEDYEQLDKTDTEIAKRVRGEVSRYQRRVPEFQNNDCIQSFVNIILAYLNSNRDIEYTPNLVPLCAPFIYVMDTECDAYFGFERLMQAIGKYTKTSIHINTYTMK